MEKECRYPISMESTVGEMISLLNKRYSAPNAVVTIFEQLTGQSFLLKVEELDEKTKEVFVLNGERKVYHFLYKKARPHWRLVNCFYEKNTKLLCLLKEQSS